MYVRKKGQIKIIALYWNNNSWCTAIKEIVLIYADNDEQKNNYQHPNRMQTGTKSIPILPEKK